MKSIRVVWRKAGPKRLRLATARRGLAIGEIVYGGWGGWYVFRFGTNRVQGGPFRLRRDAITFAEKLFGVKTT